MSRNHRAKKNLSKGFTLIDMLVALLLLGTCMIGIAALKATRVRSYEGSAQHDRAVALAVEIGAVIRAQRNPSIKYQTGIGMVCKPEMKSTQAERMADNELACWQDRVEAELPNGNASVVLDSKSNAPSYIVTISWSEPSIGTASYVRRIAAGA